MLDFINNWLSRAGKWFSDKIEEIDSLDNYMMDSDSKQLPHNFLIYPTFSLDFSKSSLDDLFLDKDKSLAKNSVAVICNDEDFSDRSNRMKIIAHLNKLNYTKRDLRFLIFSESSDIVLYFYNIFKWHTNSYLLNNVVPPYALSSEGLYLFVLYLVSKCKYVISLDENSSILKDIQKANPNIEFTMPSEDDFVCNYKDGFSPVFQTREFSLL